MQGSNSQYKPSKLLSELSPLFFDEFIHNHLPLQSDYRVSAITFSVSREKDELLLCLRHPNGWMKPRSTIDKLEKQKW